MTEWHEEPGVQEWLRHFVTHVQPQMESSGIVGSVVPDDIGDAKYWVELGASIMLGKPILVIVPEGREVPEKLRLIADEIVELGGEDADAEIQAAFERIREGLDEREDQDE